MQHFVTVSAPRRPSAALAVVALVALLFGTAPRPARADTASTTAVLLGAAAATAAIIISNNVRHKQAQANAQIGRTADGGVVLGDGRVIYPNGDVLYTGNGNGRPCNYTGYGTRCSGQPVVYYPRNYNGHDHGNHYGQYKHHKHHKHDGDRNGDGDDRHGEGRRGDH